LFFVFITIGNGNYAGHVRSGGKKISKQQPFYLCFESITSIEHTYLKARKIRFGSLLGVLGSDDNPHGWMTPSTGLVHSIAYHFKFVEKMSRG